MPHIHCDILIQAGHQNCPPGDNEGGSGPLGDEKDWTPIIADTAISILQAHDVDARKEDARLRHTDKVYDCRLAVFLHFDDPDGGESGPSVGYPHDSDRPAVDEWKSLYGQYWPFPETWRSDNTTPDEHHYYGFSHSMTSDAEFLIEFGDLGSRRQAEWMKPRLHWFGELLAHFLSKRSGLGNVPLPPPFGAKAQGSGPTDAPTIGTTAMNLKANANAAATSTPFHTKPSKSHDGNGSSKTSGLNGTSTLGEDGTLVIDATETLTAIRNGKAYGPVQARQIRVWKGDLGTVEQTGYCHDGRNLPGGILMKNINGFPAQIPAGYTSVDSDKKKSTQFGKFDAQDLGTGSEVFGITQTNSEVFGVSLKRSRLVKIFGKHYDKNPKRLTALVEVYLAESNRLVRVPLLDIGPGETQSAHIDLTWAVDQFMKTEGEKVVEFRVLTT